MLYPKCLCLRVEFDKQQPQKKIDNFNKMLEKAKKVTVTQGEFTRWGSGIEYHVRGKDGYQSRELMVVLEREKDKK